MFLKKLFKFSKGIRFRLTMVYSTLFGIFLCTYAFILTGQHLESNQKDFDEALLNYAIDISESMSSGSTGDISINLGPTEKLKHFPFSLKKTFYQLCSMDGKVLSPTPLPFNIPFDKKIAKAQLYSHRFISLSYQGLPYRAVNFKVGRHSEKTYILQVATPSSIIMEQKNRYLILNIVVIPVLIIFSSFIGYVIAGKALNPIKQLIQTANNIAIKNLSLRVPELETRDEIAELSKTLNHLLERLEKSFISQENFVANAGHQLNTPLAIIKGELDVLESKTRSPEEVEKFHLSLREEIQRLIELVRNLLLISRVEAGQENFSFYPVRLDEILLANSSRLGNKAKDKNIKIRFDIDDKVSDTEDLVVLGEKQLIDCMFENILENSIKYSPNFSTVRIFITCNLNQQIEVHIQDEGPGITPQDFLKITSKRFQRNSQLPGTGIGLSIVYKIAHSHNATIDYEALNPKGSCFKVKFSKLMALEKSLTSD